MAPHPPNAELSLDDAAGQLLMPRASRDEPPAAFLERLPLGGVILPRTLYDDARAMRGMLDRAHAIARRRNGLPPFVTCDHEGGSNAFMRGDATAVPSNMGLGATGDPASAREAASILAAELRGVGANWDLAPVADVNVNPLNPVIGVRSYGDDPRTVAAFVREAVGGFQSNGVLACAKHFPGHGDTELDSHVALPVVPHDRARLDAVELPPFRAAIAAGVASVMTAHVRFPTIDADRVATVSTAALQGLLRGELGHDGIVITDAMEMAAIAAHWDADEAVIETIRAGADVVLTGGDLAQNVRTHAAVIAAIRSGRIPRARLDSALRRIRLAKARLGEPTDPGVVGSREHRERALALARRSITVVRADALPIPRDLGDRLVVLAPVRGTATKMETWTGGRCALGEEVARFAPGAVDIQVEFPVAPPERDRILAAARRAAVVVAGTLNAALDPAQVALLEAIRDVSPARLVVVAMRTPYDLARMPWIGTYLCAYTSVAPVMTAAAEVLVGERRASGRLPVSLATPSARLRGPAASPR